ELDPAAGAIQLQTGRLQHTRRRRLAAELNLDSRNQLANEERLHDVIVRPELKAHNAIRFRRASRQKNDRNVRQLRMVPNALADIQPVRIGQHNIQQDEIRPLTAAQLDGSLTGLGAYQGKPFLLQVVL